MKIMLKLFITAIMGLLLIPVMILERLIFTYEGIRRYISEGGSLLDIFKYKVCCEEVIKGYLEWAIAD